MSKSTIGPFLTLSLLEKSARIQKFLFRISLIIVAAVILHLLSLITSIAVTAIIEIAIAFLFVSLLKHAFPLRINIEFGCVGGGWHAECLQRLRIHLALLE